MKGGDVNGGDSPSSGGFFGAGSRKRKPGLGGYEISVWSRSPGERTPACPGGEQVQPWRSRRNGWVLVVFSRKEEAAGVQQN